MKVMANTTQPSHETVNQVVVCDIIGNAVFNFWSGAFLDAPNAVEVGAVLDEIKRQLRRHEIKATGITGSALKNGTLVIKVMFGNMVVERLYARLLPDPADSFDDETIVEDAPISR